MGATHKELVIVPAQATDEMVLAGMDYPYAAVPSVLARDVYRIMVQAFDPITWEDARAQIIRELIEKALGSEADNYRAYDGYVAEWLKDQIKGE